MAVAAIATTAALTAVAGASPGGQRTAASNPCAQPTQALHGHYRGSDGRMVNATLALTLSDAAGHEIDTYGCRLTHDMPAFFVNPNFAIPAEGSTTQGTDVWDVAGIPANARHVQIETYPRSPASAPRYQVTNLTFYGRSMRKLALPTDDDLQVVLPRADDCPSARGVGTVLLRAVIVGPKGRLQRIEMQRGRVAFALKPDTLSLADAFSALPDRNDPGTGSPVQGIALGHMVGRGATLLAIATAAGKGQPYTLVIHGGHFGGRAYSTDYKGRQTFGAQTCKQVNAIIYEIPRNLSVALRHAVQDQLHTTMGSRAYLLTVNS